MDLKLYDTLTREKRVFTPLDPANVRMYVCGPTVYDFAHIGNARPVIVFDVLFRLLRHLAKQGVWDGGKGETTVTYVRNITDVDDKINARAAERIAARGESGADLNTEIRALTEETYRNFSEDVAALGCLKPTYEPRATEYVSRADGRDMVSLIATLIRNGNAYVAEGHVLFDVSSMPDYGALSKRPLDEMIAGARVEVAPYKRSAMDFVLWKPSAPNEPGWESPWGRGRPGWHIECSAMSAALLGKEFDIHGGGIDLVFPHHENEIAQSRCAFHTPMMANYWMHNGFLQVEGEKMSKSVGNFVTIREALDVWPAEVVRLNMLKTHYRQPIDWTMNSLEESQQIIRSWADALQPHGLSIVDSYDPPEEVLNALSDDLNTSKAFASMHGMAKAGKQGDRSASRALSGAADFLGLQRSKWDRKVQEFVFKAAVDKEFDDRVEALLAARIEARKEKKFSEADRIRDELAAMGVVLKDSKDGTTWEIAR